MRLLTLQRSAAAFVRARHQSMSGRCSGPARICAARCASSKRGSGRPRSYRYVVDHAGAVHLDTNKARTLATAYKDPTFLDELYTGLRRRRGGKWASQCLGEYSLLRADTGDSAADAEIIVVFDRLNDDGLGYAGTLREAFDPSRLRWCASGRLYHELTTASRFGKLGLVGSHVAHGLSERLDVRDGDDVRLDWRGASYPVAPVSFPTAEPPFVCS
ncbi:unnamed protein product [Pelagomonas calceolata]|uniref:Uncharacterized protein n=2 Tax=Pelagomonas calceolata TaxID=35677 RepID=A0A8J2SLX3_9STRA|nr:unnamed protein product [Pelagomonas calceolata]